MVEKRFKTRSLPSTLMCFQLPSQSNATSWPEGQLVAPVCVLPQSRLHFVTLAATKQQRAVESAARSTGTGRCCLIDSQPLHGPLGLSFFVHGACRVLRVYGGEVGVGEKSDCTNNVESPPTALEPPHAVWRVVLNAGETACRFPQEQTCR